MGNRAYKRRRILIDDAQYRLLAFNLIYFLSTLLVIAAVLFVPLMIQFESGSLSLLEKQEIANQILSLHTMLWPALLILFLFLTIHSIFVSHRIWGALYRFRSVFKRVSEGDLSARANIRKGDYLVKEANLLNQMIESLGARMKGIEEQYQQLSALFAGLKRSTESGSARETSRHIEGLQAMMEQLKDFVDPVKAAAEEKREQGNPEGGQSSASAADASR